jgi:hypothetical protein
MSGLKLTFTKEPILSSHLGNKRRPLPKRKDEKTLSFFQVIYHSNLFSEKHLVTQANCDKDL